MAIKPLRMRWRIAMTVAASVAVAASQIIGVDDAKAEQALRDKAMSLMPAVVTVVARAAPNARRTTSSGFVIDPSGVIVTTAAAVAEGDDVEIQFEGQRPPLPAVTVGRDERTKVVVLKVEATSALPALRFGDSNAARVGDPVAAIGSPPGLKATVSLGSVTALHRDIDELYDDGIQTSVLLNLGALGGPLLNAAGEVIGVNHALQAPTTAIPFGISFAISSAVARRVVDEIRVHGRVRWPTLGVNIQGVNGDTARIRKLDRPRGALVVTVNPGGSAARAKLQPGDIILSLDGKDVPRVSNVPRIMPTLPLDRPVKVEIWRDGKPINVDVQLDEVSQR